MLFPLMKKFVEDDPTAIAQMPLAEDEPEIVFAPSCTQTVFELSAQAGAVVPVLQLSIT